jgi:hypothetical protein
MARSTGRSVRMIRAWRVLLVLMIILDLFFATAAALAGQGVALITFAATLFVSGVVTFQTFAIRRLEARSGRRYPLAEPVLRKITGRREPDYELIARLERECGIEPGESVEVPAPVTRIVRPARGGIADDRLAAQALAEESAFHVALLDKAGRDCCLSPCNLCQHLGRQGLSAGGSGGAGQASIFYASGSPVVAAGGNGAQQWRRLDGSPAPHPPSADDECWLDNERWEQS